MNPRFDVNAATQAYLALLQGPARAQSDAYFTGGYWLPLWSALFSLVLYWLLLRTGVSARMRGWAERVTQRRWLQPALYALPFVVVTSLVLLTWTIYTDFVREGQYGLMNQSFGGWFADWLKGEAIALVVTALVFIGIFAGIRNMPRRWWLAATAGTTVFIAFAALIAPVFVAPLFNTYTEMPAGPLRDRIVAVAAANDIPADMADMERKFRIEQAMESGKPKEIAEKMVEGGMRKFFEEIALLEQPFVMDESKKVKEMLPAGANVTKFVRWQVGETV